MTRVMLDMGTLRSARRLLGPKAERTDAGQFADLDIAALSALLEAIVLFDEVVIPDLGHQHAAESVHGLGEAVKLMEIESAQRDDISSAASRWMSEWSNIENFIRLLGGHPLYTHDGNTYQYLLLQAIGVRNKYESILIRWVRKQRSYDRKYFFDLKRAFRPDHRDENMVIQHNPELTETLLNEPPKKIEGGILKNYPYPMVQHFWNEVLEQILSDLNLPYLYVGGHPEIDYDDFVPGNPHLQWVAGSEMITFCANLAWIVFRTRCYDLASRAHGMPYMPHPLRARLAGFSSAHDDPNVDQTSCALGYIDALEKVYHEAQDVAAKYAHTTFLPLRFSPLLPYLIKKAGKKEHLIEAAYQVRTNRGARDLRDKITALDGEIHQGSLREAVRLHRELNELTQTFRQSLGLEDYAAPKIALSVGGIVSVDVPKELIPRFLLKKSHPFKPRFLFLRNVFDELAAASSLGKLYEVLYSD